MKGPEPLQMEGKYNRPHLSLDNKVENMNLIWGCDSQPSYFSEDPFI